MSNSRQRFWAQAQRHAASQDWARARQEYERILEVEPGNADVLLQLSYIESLSGHYRLARARALEAFAVRPRAPQVLGELAARLRTFNEVESLFQCIDGFVADGLPHLPTALALAAHLSNLNQPERALQLLDATNRKWPGQAVVLVVRGSILTFLGRMAEAEEALRACLRLAPGMAQAYWALSRLDAGHHGQAEVGAIRRCMARERNPPQDVILFSYALHKMLDGMGDYQGAVVALRDGCRAKRMTLQYSQFQSHELFDALIDSPGAVATGPVEWSLPGMSSRRIPIFVVGMHRSGTTLLEQLLDGHSDVKGVGELYDFTSQMRYATDHHCRGVIDATIVERAGSVDFEAVGRSYLGKMEWRLGRERYFTDKLPSNFLNIGFICRALPQAKILHMVRDPVETCFSNLRELFSDANPYSYDQLELADYYKQYRRLMAHWHRTWPGRILDVDYAELTRDPETVMRRVAAFCGLEYEAGMLDIAARERGVATASAVQVRQGIVARERPKWAPYEEYLQPLIQALRE
jgi:tetratricopeptide (TPR) repeat protein